MTGSDLRYIDRIVARFRFGMTKKFSVLLPTFLVAVLFAQTARQPSKPAQPPVGISGPSLNETMAWLEDKIGQFAGWRVKYVYNGTQQEMFTRQSVSFDDRCGLTTTAWVGATETSTRAMSTLMLQDLNSNYGISARSTLTPGGTYISGNATATYVSFPIIQGRPRIKVKTSTQAGLPQDSTVSEFGINFTDKDMANRVAKAMAHAILLCQAEHPEPF